MVIPLNATQRVRLLIDTSYLPDGVGSRAHLATGPHRQVNRYGPLVPFNVPVRLRPTI